MASYRFLFKQRVFPHEDTVQVWQKIETTEDPEWTQRYHSQDPTMKSFGGRLEISALEGEKKLLDEKAVALFGKTYSEKSYAATLSER